MAVKHFWNILNICCKEIAWVLSVYGAIPASILQQRIEIEIHANHLSIQSIKSKKKSTETTCSSNKVCTLEQLPT